MASPNALLDRPAPKGPEPALVADYAESLTSIGENVRSSDRLIEGGYIPDIHQVGEIRTYLDYLGPLAQDTLGEESFARLSQVANPDNWLENPDVTRAYSTVLSDAAEILYRRQDDALARMRGVEHPKTRAHAKLNLSGRLTEDQILEQAENLLVARFGTSRITPGNMQNAIDLMHDALEVKEVALADQAVSFVTPSGRVVPESLDLGRSRQLRGRALANLTDYNSGRATSDRAVGVARVKENLTEGQAPGGAENLLWLVSKGADPRDVKNLLFANKTVRGQGGAWASLPNQGISKAEKAEVRQLSRQLGIVNGIKRGIHKGGGVPTEVNLLDQLVGRRESLDDYTPDERALVQAVRGQLEAERTAVQAQREYRQEQTAKTDRLARLRHTREDLITRGKRLRGDTDVYHEGYETGEGPQRGIVAHWLGTTVVWAATQLPGPRQNFAGRIGRPRIIGGTLPFNGDNLTAA